MKLSQFIEETLTEIAVGIQSAKLRTGDIWAISPKSVQGVDISEKSEIEFDVAVTVEETSTKGKDGKAGVEASIQVMGVNMSGQLGGGASLDTTKATTIASRVAFKVPVYMNTHYRGDKALAEEREFFMGEGKAKMEEARKK